MRGGEGLGRAVEYAAFRRGNEVALPFYHNAEITVPFGRKEVLCIQETTSYPFDNRVDIRVISAPKRDVTLSLAHASWMEDFKVTLNGKKPLETSVAEGMASITMKLKAGDRIQVAFDMKPRIESTLNSENNESGSFKVFCGPLLLAAQDACPEGFARTSAFESLGGNMFLVEGTDVILSPLYHLMEQKVDNTAQPPYARRVVF